MKQEVETDAVQQKIYPRIIMGLDISTACIGVAIVKDDGTDNAPEILSITHKTPKTPKKIKGIESLFLKKNIFEEEFIKTITGYGITDVVIEEPLLSSNNVNTVASLIRFNTMIAESVYNILGLVPNFISSYDARMFSFPDLCSIRKYNKKGEEYPLKHIKDAIKNDNAVLFGAYPFDIDKKSVMMNKVNELYHNGEIEWILNNKNELRKENYDACDALVCALAYINVNHHGIEEPKIVDSELIENKDSFKFTYHTKIWDKIYEKTLILSK